MKVTFTKKDITFKAPNPDGSFYGVKITHLSPLYNWFMKRTKEEIINLFDNEVRIIDSKTIEFSFDIEGLKHKIPMILNCYPSIDSTPILDIVEDVDFQIREDIINSGELDKLRVAVKNEMLDNTSIILKDLRNLCIMQILGKN